MNTSTGVESAARIRIFERLKPGGFMGPLIGLIMLFIALVVVMYGLDVMDENGGRKLSRFLAVNNFLNILDQITVLGIVAIGMTFVILIGGIDLSVGSVLALSMMIMGYFAIEHDMPMAVAIPAALIISMLVGMMSGLLITMIEIPPFIATLAMMTIARGMAGLVTNGQQMIGFPDWVNDAARVRYFGFITLTMLAVIIIAVAALIYQQYRAGGRKLYAIGGNPEVARLAGINVKLSTIAVYMFCSLLAGIAGIISAARIDAAQHTSGVMMELDAIAAVVIGGTALSGGRGGVIGTIIGVLIIGLLRNGLNLLSITAFWQQVIIGVVILFAVGAEKFGKHKQ